MSSQMTPGPLTHEAAVAKAVKLLRLAQSDNAHEAAQAASRAQDIIDRYKLGSLGLSADAETTRPDEPIMDLGSAPLEESARLAAWKDRLASVVARANQCRIYINNNGRTRRIALVGRPSDAETVRYIYAWLRREIDRLAERDGRGLGVTWRNNFRLGVVDTVRDRLREQRKATEADALSAARAEAGAIVLVQSAIQKMEANGLAVDGWMDSNLKLRSARRASIRQDQTAREAGRKAGREIALARPTRGLGAGRGALKAGVSHE